MCAVSAYSNAIGATAMVLELRPFSETQKTQPRFTATNYESVSFIRFVIDSFITSRQMRQRQRKMIA